MLEKLKQFARKALLTLLLLVGTVAFAAGGWYLSKLSFGQIHEMRQLERIPRTPINAVIEGEVNLAGRVARYDRILRSPDTNTPCVYYHYTIEEEETDSDGNTHWEVVHSSSDAVPFLLDDSNGKILIEPSQHVDFNVDQSMQEVRGYKRYTEYRIDVSQRVLTFGYADRASDVGWHVRYDMQGSYQPMISENTALGERQDKILWSGLSLMGGLTGLSFAVIFLLGVFRVHSSSVYLTAVAMVVAPVLLYQGAMMMKNDLVDADERLERTLASGKSEVTRIFEKNDANWNGAWTDLGEIDSSDYDEIDEKEAKRIRDIRLSLARSVQRTNANLNRFPENILAGQWGLDEREPLPLPERERDRLDALESDYETTKLPASWSLLGILIGVVVCGGGVWGGLRKYQIKRMIENIPTAPTNGLAYGVSEIKGVAETDEYVLQGPLSESECIYYHYVVKRKDDDDWDTIRNETKSVSFLCRDDAGTIRVDDEGARFETDTKVTRRSGNKKYIEESIRPGDDLYVLGKACIDSDTHEDLYIAEDEDGDIPFIVASIPEKALKYREGRTGAILTNLGMLGAIFLALAVFGAVATFGPALYTTTAAMSVAFVFVALVLLYYNDLIFLRRWVERNWSNIDVSLKKRYDLITNLSNVVKGYLDHEDQVQKTLAGLRGAHGGSEIDPESSERAFEQESQLVDQFIATIESYPELKGDEMVSNLMDNLTEVENEIALMRQGFNDSVERYNTRLSRFPEVVLAKAFGFQQVSHFHAEQAAHATPDVSDAAQ